MSSETKEEKRAEVVIDTVAKMAKAKRKKKNKKKKKNKNKQFSKNVARPRNKNDGLMRKVRKRIPTIVANKSGYAKLSQFLTGTHLHQYVECQIDPFSPAGIGAQRPDETGGNKIPSMDRFLYTLVPTLFTSETPKAHQVIAFAVVFLPRCMRAGWWTGTETQDLVSGVKIVTPDIPFTMYDTDQAVLEPSESPTGVNKTVVNTPFADAYSLMVLPITSDGWTLRRSTPAEATASSNNQLQMGYNLLRYPRYDTYSPSVEGSRILGCGVKLLGTAPSLQMGGYCYAGSIKIKEIYELLIEQNKLFDSGEIIGPFLNIKNKIADCRGFKATQGVTSRYVPLHDKEQMKFEPNQIDLPKMSYSNFALSNARICDICAEKQKYEAKYSEYDGIKFPNPGNVSKSTPKDFVQIKSKTPKYNNNDNPVIDSYESSLHDDYKDALLKHQKWVRKSKFGKLKPHGLGQVPSNEFLFTYKQIENADWGTNDLAGPDDPVPILYFQYDFATDSSGAITSVSNYNLELRSRVHIENTSKGDSAFIGEDPTFDPGLETVEAFIKNSANVEVSASGHSFKSIFTKIGQFAGHVAKHASRAESIAKLILG